MLDAVNNEGLGRLVALELNRLHPQSHEEARRVLIDRMGAYDDTRITIELGINSYFKSQ